MSGKSDDKEPHARVCNVEVSFHTGLFTDIPPQDFKLNQI